MIITIKSTPANVAGMGPVAWNRDEQVLSMHPPLPEHIEYVEEYMAQHEHEQAHQIMYRRDFDEQCEESLVSHIVQKEDFQRTPHPHLNHMRQVIGSHRSAPKELRKHYMLHLLHHHKAAQAAHDEHLSSGG